MGSKVSPIPPFSYPNHPFPITTLPWYIVMEFL